MNKILAAIILMLVFTIWDITHYVKTSANVSAKLNLKKVYHLKVIRKQVCEIPAHTPGQWPVVKIDSLISDSLQYKLVNPT